MDSTINWDCQKIHIKFETIIPLAIQEVAHLFQIGIIQVVGVAIPKLDSMETSPKIPYLWTNWLYPLALVIALIGLLWSGV
mgnify:CR=1 FL=1